VNISTKPYNRHWGSVPAACRQLALYHAGKITRKALLRPLVTTPHRPAIRPSLRFAVLKRDNHTCQSCGRAAPHVKLELDHIIPVRDGGQDTPDNLRTLCRECNRGKA
jgi:5-methylcytosine-specific restriction endonuclease McrA